MLQGSCSPDNHASSPTDEAVEAFFASVQAHKVDVTGGLQQRLQEEGIQVEVGGAQDEGMCIGRGGAGSEDEVAEMEAGMAGVSDEGAGGRHDEGKDHGTGGTEGSAGSVQSAEPGSSDRTSTEQWSMLAAEPPHDVVPRNAQVKNIPTAPTIMLRRRRGRSRSRSLMETLSRRLTFTLRFREPRDQLTVSSGRWVQVGELLQLQRFHNYSVRDIRNAVSICAHRYTDRPRFEEMWDRSGRLLIRMRP